MMDTTPANVYASALATEMHQAAGLPEGPGLARLARGIERLLADGMDRQTVRNTCWYAWFGAPHPWTEPREGA